MKRRERSARVGRQRRLRGVQCGKFGGRFGGGGEYSAAAVDDATEPNHALVATRLPKNARREHCHRGGGGRHGHAASLLQPAGDEQCMVGLPPTPDELSHLIWDPRVSPDGQFNEIKKIDAGLSPPQGQRGVSSKADGRLPSAEAMLIGLPPTAEQLQDHPHIDQDGFSARSSSRRAICSRLFGECDQHERPVGKTRYSHVDGIESRAPLMYSHMRFKSIHTTQDR